MINQKFQERNYQRAYNGGEMKKIILLFSHTLTEPQVKELKENWDCEEIIYMPDELKNNWMNVADDVDISQFKRFLLDNLSCFAQCIP